MEQQIMNDVMTLDAMAESSVQDNGDSMSVEIDDALFAKINGELNDYIQFQMDCMDKQYWDDGSTPRGLVNAVRDTPEWNDLKTAWKAEADSNPNVS